MRLKIVRSNGEELYFSDTTPFVIKKEELFVRDLSGDLVSRDFLVITIKTGFFAKLRIEIDQKLADKKLLKKLSRWDSKATIKESHAILLR